MATVLAGHEAEILVRDSTGCMRLQLTGATTERLIEWLEEQLELLRRHAAEAVVPAQAPTDA